MGNRQTLCVASTDAGITNELVVELAARGWPVFPVHSVNDGRCSCRKGSACRDPGKHPRVKGWEQEATTDGAVIGRWSAKWPGCNWGLATGPATLVVIDTDTSRGGEDSDVTLQ